MRQRVMRPDTPRTSLIKKTLILQGYGTLTEAARDLGELQPTFFRAVHHGLSDRPPFHLLVSLKKAGILHLIARPSLRPSLIEGGLITKEQVDSLTPEIAAELETLGVENKA